MTAERARVGHVADLASPAPVVLVGHGSRDPRSAATMAGLAAAVGRGWPDPVTAAYLDFDQPSVPDALRGQLSRAPGAIPIVLPVLLTSAHHGRVDLPRVLRATGVPVRLAPVLGPAGPAEPPDRLLVAALRRRLSDADTGFDGVALLAAGTSYPAARSTVEGVAAALAAELDVPCSVGYASASPPGPVAAVAAVRAMGARRIAAAAYFLAPGRLYEAAATEARRAGVVAVAQPLGVGPELVDLITDRLRVVAEADRWPVWPMRLG
ncbi:MAG TPA: CbiX/SirB N-terminal domain-containing protein [Micromonosporaceae bacterium]